MTSSLLFNVTTFAYLISMVLFFAFLASRSKAIGTGGSLAAYAGFIAQTIAIGLRWKESYDLGHGHAPLSNLYESVVFFSWTIILIFGILDTTFNQLGVNPYLKTVLRGAIIILAVASYTYRSKREAA